MRSHAHAREGADGFDARGSGTRGCLRKLTLWGQWGRLVLCAGWLLAPMALLVPVLVSYLGRTPRLRNAKEIWIWNKNYYYASLDLRSLRASLAIAACTWNSAPLALGRGGGYCTVQYGAAEGST